MSKKYEIIVGSAKDKEQWNSFIENNDGLIFHKYEWLEIIQETGGYKFLPLMVFKGEVLKAVFPVFKKSFFTIKTVTSPPPKFGIPELGPVLIYDKNSSKNEIENVRILEELLAYIHEVIKFDLLNINLSHNIGDFRAFVWNNMKITPTYTYYIWLRDGDENIFNSFDSRIKRSIKKANKEQKFEIKISYDGEGLDKLVDSVRERYKEQGLSYPLKDSYLNKIKKQFNDNLHTILALDNGEIINGLVLLVNKKRIFFWIGGNKTEKSYRGLNEKLHWAAIGHYSGKGFELYDLFGANTRHLVDYKAKYNPELIQYSNVSKQNFKARLGLKVYKLLNR